MMLIIRIFLLVLFLNLSPFSVNAFVADPEVKTLADHFDKKYFPIFLKTLNEIRSGECETYSNFFKEELQKSFKDKPVINLSNIIIKNKIEFLNGNPQNHPGYIVEFPINWAANPENNNTWVFNFHNLLWLETYLEKGEKGDITSTMIALKIIQDWIQANTEYPAKTSKFVFDDHGTAERLKVYLRALRAYQKLEVQDPEFNKIFFTSILGHIALMASEEKYLNWHNHGVIFDVRLLEVLNKFPEFVFREELQGLAAKRVLDQFKFSFTEEGVHREHTPCYHFHVSSMLLRAIELIFESGQKVSTELIELADKTAEFYTYTLEPDGTFPNIGDCSGEKKWFPYVQGEIGKSYYENHPELRYALSGGNEGKKPNDKIKIFKKSGWAIFRDQWPTNILAIVQSDFNSFGHYQEDDTSFTLSAYGFDFIIDNGLYSYDKGPMEDYMRRSRAHNVLLVNNEDFNFNLKNTGLSGITRYLINDNNNHDWKGIVELTHGHYIDKGIEISRQFGQLEQHSFSILDIVKSSNENIYSQIFHLSPEAKVEIFENKIFKITWEGNPYVLWLLSDFDSFKIIEGEMDPVQGWYFPAFMVAKKQPTLVVNKSGSNIEFHTLISILKNGQEPDWNNSLKSSTNMHKSLDAIERAKMVRSPVPERWKISR